MTSHLNEHQSAGIPQQPLLAVSCHQPGRTMGRCRPDRLKQVFDHPWSASYLISPLLLHQTTTRYFKGDRSQQLQSAPEIGVSALPCRLAGVKDQLTLSTGMTAIALARQMCAKTHIYGFGNGSCGNQCYHYYECNPSSRGASQVGNSSIL